MKLPLLINPNPKKATEAVLTTYGTLFAIILTASAFAAGFGKTNIFAIIAFAPLVIYFLHDLMHKIFPGREHTHEVITDSFFSFQAFLLQDNLLFRVSLSLFFVALIASFAKFFVINQAVADSAVEVLSQPASL